MSLENSMALPGKSREETQKSAEKSLFLK